MAQKHYVYFPNSASTDTLLSGDTYKLILTVTHASGVLPYETRNADEQGFKITDHGKLSWKYALEDAFLVPGSLDLELSDNSDRYIHDLFFGTDAATSFESAKVEIQLNGSTEFIGYIVEDTLYSDYGNRVISFEARPRIDILNRTGLFTDDGIPLDPLGYTDYNTRNITTAVYSSGEVTIWHDATDDFDVGDFIKVEDVEGMTDLNGVFEVSDNIDNQRIKVELETNQTYTSGGTVKKLDSSDYYSIVNMLEDIYQLVDSSITYASGKLNIFHDWEFKGKLPNSPYTILYDIELTELDQYLKYMFFDSTLGLDNLGAALRKLAKDWCCFTGMVHSQKAFFKRLFYYNSSNLQTLGTVGNILYGYQHALLDYVKATVGATTEFHEYHAPDRQSYGGLDAGRLVIENVIPGFYEGDNSSWSAVQATIARGGADDGTYWIWQAKDANIDGGAWHDNGYLIAWFWYNARNEMKECRVDQFKDVQGVNYDFLKDFNYGGNKYQPIGMEKDFEKCTTTIDALYLGAV